MATAECHPTLKGGRRETKYSHGYPPYELETLTSISEAFIPPIPLNSDEDSTNKAADSFYQSSASQYPVPDEVYMHTIVIHISKVTNRVFFI